MNKKEEKEARAKIEAIAKRMSFGNTQGSQKLLSYVQHIIDTDEFQDKVRRVREACNIPEKGLSSKKYGVLNEPFGDINGNFIKIIHNEIKDICKKYNLHIVDWEHTFSAYIYYNKFIKPYDFTMGHLCHIVDIKEEKEDPFSKEIVENDDTIYPIAIKISPYATKRDIIDFVNKSYLLIDYFQAEYRDKKNLIGSFKKRNPRIVKRNQFIYKNRNLPLKEIANRLQTKLNVDIDEGHISKIISLEKHRRQKA